MICDTCWGRAVVKLAVRPGAVAAVPCPGCDGQGTVEVEEPARLPMFPVSFTVTACEGSPALA